MRYVIMLLLVIITTAACKKEQLASTQPLNEMVIDTTMSSGNNGSTDTTAMLVVSGSFMAGPYGTASGKASVYKTSSGYVLQLTNFSVTNGPALHVYLSKEAMPVNYIDLGTLKSTNGNQVYTIPNQPDFTAYKYISIHCVAFNHLFGSALLN